MNSKFKVIFLVVFLSIQPVLAKDKVKKDSVKSAEDKVTLVCTYQEVSKIIKGTFFSMAGGTDTYQICKECEFSDRYWEISPATYSWKSNWKRVFNRDRQVFAHSSDKLVIDRYSGNLEWTTTFHTQQDENSEIIDQLKATGTCKKVDAPVL